MEAAQAWHFVSIRVRPPTASYGDAVDSLMRGGTLRRTCYDPASIQRNVDPDLSGARSTRPIIERFFPRT